MFNVHVLKIVLFCTGELSAVVTDPHDSKVNVMVIRAADDNSQTIKFTPRIEG